jgi:tetratricopeptide (TPR) repeat protein
LRKTGKTKRAFEIYHKAFGIDPKNPYVLSGLGLLYFDKGDYEKALGFWINLLAIEPDDIKVLTNAGNCYRKLKQFNEALKYFYKALNLEENNFYALYGIADCYRGLKEYNKAAEYWHKIIKIDPDNKKILTRLGDSYRNMGNEETARYYYKRAIEKEFDYYAILGLSILDKAQKNYKAAIENLTMLERVSGLNPSLALLLSECYMDMNNREMGIKVLSSALNQGTGSRELRQRLKILKGQK